MEPANPPQLARSVLPGLALIALLGVGEVLYATWRCGIGVSPDSVAYLAAARGIASGHGVAIPTAGGQWEALRLWPPLYPALLAVPACLGLDLLRAAQCLNVLAFAGTLVLCALIVWRQTRSPLASLWAAALLVFAPPMLLIHINAWSEPPFILFLLAALALVAEHLNRPSLWKLATSGLLVGLAMLTRYVGIAMLPALGAGIVFFSGGALARRWRDTVILGIMACLPAASWRMIHGSTSHEMVSHIGIAHQASQIAAAIANWFLPGDVPAAVCAAIALPLFCLILLAPFFLIRRAAICVGWLSWFFAIAYLAMVVVSIAFFDAAIPIDKRILAPFYVAVVLLAVCVAHRCISSPAARKTALALALLLLADQAARVVMRLPILNRDGAGGYTQKVWRESPTLARFKALQLAPDAAIYSNCAEVFEFRLHRVVQWLPEKYNLYTRRNNDALQQQLADLARHHQDGRVIFVMFDPQRDARPNQPTGDELGKVLPLRVVAQFDDGTIYELAKPSDH